MTKGYYPSMGLYKVRIMLDHSNAGKLNWRVCVGRRLNHACCRVYTNRRWGVKVTVHVQTLKERDLTVLDPRSLRRLAERAQRFMPESEAEELGHYFGMKADRVVRAFERK